MKIKEFEKKVGDIVESTIEKALDGLDIEGKAKNIIEKTIEEKGLADIKKKIFGNTEKIAKLEGKEKTAKFIQAVAKKDTGTIEAILNEKALVEGTDSAGGYLVPEEFRAEVVRMAEDYGIIRKLARVIPMKRDTLNLPKVTASVTVYWPGEAVAGTASQPTLGQVQLLAKTCVGLSVLSNELLEDADVDTIDLLVELFAEAIAGEEDSQGLVGSGSPFTGILNTSGVNIATMGAGDTAFSNLDADDLRDMISRLKPLALAGAGFIMHRSVWGIVQKLKENSQHIASFSNPLVTGDASKGTGVVGYIWGYPVYLSEKMPSTSAADTKFIIFGNLKYLYFGDRKQMSLKVSEEATVGSTNTFESNMSAVRITERIGMAVGLETAFCVLKTAAA